MATQSSPMTLKSAANPTTSPSGPSKSIQCHASSSSVRIIEPVAIAEGLSSPPTGLTPQAGRPWRGRPASPSWLSLPHRTGSLSRSIEAVANVRTRGRALTHPTTGLLSPWKVISKHLVPSSLGANVVRVTHLRMLEPQSSEYSPASSSLPRYSMHGQVGVGSLISPLLERGEGGPLTQTRDRCGVFAHHPRSVASEGLCIQQ